MTFHLDIQLQQITSLQVICKVSKATLHDVDEAVMAAKEAFEEGPWGGMNARDRGEIMYKLVKRLKVIALITYSKLFNDIKVFKCTSEDNHHEYQKLFKSHKVYFTLTKIFFFTFL